jgi:hypothetical protein
LEFASFPVFALNEARERLSAVDCSGSIASGSEIGIISHHHSCPNRNSGVIVSVHCKLLSMSFRQVHISREFNSKLSILDVWATLLNFNSWSSVLFNKPQIHWCYRASTKSYR